MQLSYLLLAASGLAALCFASDWDRAPVRDREVIHRSFPLAGNPYRVVIENVNGFVHVAGSKSGAVELTAEKIIRADSDSDLAEAKRDVQLEFDAKPGSVSAYYRAPNDDRGSHRRRFYSVTYNIDLKIPTAARAFLSTVNGEIHLNGTTGDFELKSVNGPIDVAGVAGSGKVNAVNGPIHAAWIRNPQWPCQFKTINGSIDLTLQSNLAANLAFQTMRGEIFSDFDVTPGPAPAIDSERSEARFVYRSHGMRLARIGGGGPELRFETLNGDMRIHSAKRNSYANE